MRLGLNLLSIMVSMKFRRNPTTKNNSKHEFERRMALLKSDTAECIHLAEDAKYCLYNNDLRNAFVDIMYILKTDYFKYNVENKDIQLFYINNVSHTCDSLLRNFFKDKLNKVKKQPSLFYSDSQYLNIDKNIEYFIEYSQVEFISRFINIVLEDIDNFKNFRKHLDSLLEWFSLLYYTDEK